MNPEPDIVDGVVADVHTLYPKLEIGGLPITGRVLRLALIVQARRERTLSEFGLSVADFDVLATLRRRSAGGSVNVRDLQHSTMLSSGGMTKRLDRLEAAGHIERQPDPADRRGVLIRLTRAGASVIDKAIPAVTKSETAFVRTAVNSATERGHAEHVLRRLLIAGETDDNRS